MNACSGEECFPWNSLSNYLCIYIYIYGSFVELFFLWLGKVKVDHFRSKPASDDAPHSVAFGIHLDFVRDTMISGKQWK